MPSQVEHTDFPSHMVSGPSSAWEHPCICYKQWTRASDLWSLHLYAQIVLFVFMLCQGNTSFENHTICPQVMMSSPAYHVITPFTYERPMVSGLISSDALTVLALVMMPTSIVDS